MSSDNSEEEEVRPPSPLHLPAYLDGNTDYQFHEKELRLVEEETQRRIKTLLEGTGELSKLDPQTLSDPEILRRLTSSVSSALDEAASALTRMRSEGGGTRGDTTPRTTSTAVSSVATTSQSLIREGDSSRLLAEACAQGDWLAVQSLLAQGRGLHEPGEDGESLLSLACSAGYYELVEVLLKMRAGVEDRGLRGEGDCTPLMEAASGGYADIVSLLLDHGAEVNAKSAAGNTALTYACCGGYGDVVKVLLDAGALVEEPNENGHTPLMEAASGGHIAVAKLLLQRGANINTHSAEFKESALTLACYKGHLEMVRFLLEAGADQEHKTDEMHTALMEASMDGHVDVARLLLDHGAQVNMPADSFESPLTLAASGGHYELAALLISRGADLEEVNDEGYTPLMEASREGHEDVVRLLMESGANNEAQTEETQETALTLACCGGFLSVVQYLLERGAGLEQGASTPLMEAAQEGHYEVVQYLIQQGANIHATSAALDSAFTCACSNGHSKVADLLLHHGSDMEHPSEGGRTPLMKAARAGHMDTVRFLVERGADVNRWTTSRDHTVLSLACAGGHLGIVQYLIAQGADPVCFLKDNSTMLIEAARGGHTAIVCLLLKQAMGLPTPLSVPALPHPPATHAPPTLQQQALVQASQVGLIEGMTHALRHQALPPRNISRTAAVPPHPLPDGAPATMATTLPAFTQPSGPRKGLVSSTSRKRAAPEDSSDDSSDEEQGLPLPHAQRLDPIGQSTQPIAIEEHVQPMMPVVPMRLPSNSYLGDFDNPRLPDFLPPRNRGLLKPLRGTGMRRAFSLEAIPSELMYHSLDSPAYQLEGCPGHAYQPSVGLPLVPGVGREAEFSNITMPTNQEILQFQEMLVRRVQEAQGQPGGFYGYNEDDDFDDEGPGHHGDENDDDGGEGDDEDEGDEDDMDPPDRCFAGPPEAILPPPRGRAPQGLALQLDAQTESNHDTALTLAAQGGHDELVQVLLAHGSDLEHRDKKGCTPLILAASAGHSLTVSTLLEHGAIIEAVSDRTKDTALSLACSGGRQEVVDILLQKGGNFEHRNVSDYTPLSLAASGGYVSIMKALLKNGADVNSRTGSKLGISPLMLAAMNGHTQAAKLLLDHGADINAQIETNRNTALTLACFQGRHEVVSLLCQRAANVEHRAKTGLTPLMEAASGGYHEVGRILVEHGADVNALPVPSSKDTALTIAADKGHAKFVDMILRYGANVDVKNKKGNSPLWLACNGGHLEAVRCLVSFKADPDSQDNRKVSCLMIAFRKGHVKVVKYLVDYVSHFPADSDCKRFIATLSDKDHAKKCSQCLDIISSAKERQAAEANKNASILLQELDLEKQNEEQKKLAAAKKRERKKRQKEKKKAKASEDTKGDDDLAAELCDEIEEVHQPEVLVVTTTASASTPSNSAVATVTAVVSIATRANSLPSKPVVTNTVTVSAALRSESVLSPRNSKVDTLATKHSTAGVTTATSATTTVATSSTVVPVTMATISPRKGRKEEGWREVPKKSKVATRRPRSMIHPPHSSVDLPHHHGNQLVGRDNRVKLNFATPPPHLSPQPSPPTSLAQAGSGRGDKLGRGKPSVGSTQQTQPSPPKANAVSGSHDNSVTMPTTKVPLMTPPSSQPAPAAQGSGPVRKRMPSQYSPSCCQSSSMVVTTTIAVTTKQALTAISTATSSVRSLSQVVCQGGKPPVRLTTQTTPAATSVTMTTKKPISSTTVSVKSRSADVKMARKVAASRQPESRAKSTASKGISYSAVVGGTKVKEDNPAFNVPLLSTTLSSIATNSDGVYQPFGPVQVGNSPPKTTSPSDKEWPGSSKKALGIEAWGGGGASDHSPWVFGVKTSIPGETAVTPVAAESASPTNSKVSPVSSDSPLSVSTSVASTSIMTGKDCSKILGPIGPPSRSDKSPQYSVSHSHSPPHTTAEHTREHTRETLSSPDTTPPTSRKDGRGHPLLPTPIGPPPAMRGVGDSPTQYPLKSPTLAMLPLGGAIPFPIRSPRPPLLSTPHYPTTVPQPHMAIFPCALQATTGGLPPPNPLQVPVLTDALPPGVYPDPASLGAEPQGMFPFTKNSASGFNPNATPFIPTFVQRIPGQPVPAGTGDTSPQGMMGVPLDQLPRGVVVQPPPMQAIYPNQFNHQEGPPKLPTADGEWGKPFNQRGLLPVPPVLMPGGAIPVTMVTHPAMSPGSVPTMLLPVQSLDTAGGGSIALMKAAVATRLFDYPPPIGTERAHKRSSSHGSPASFGQMPLPGGVSLYGGQDLWSFNAAPSSDNQKAPSGYTWTDNAQTSTEHTSPVSDEEGGVANEEVAAGEPEGAAQGEVTIASCDSIETILDRLSLSQHLELFQRNEIDMNALLLMTDKDYKEMGLEEGPRVKLLSAIVGSRSRSTALGETSAQTEGAWPEENTQSSEQ